MSLVEIVLLLVVDDNEKPVVGILLMLSWKNVIFSIVDDTMLLPNVDDSCKSIVEIS